MRHSFRNRNVGKALQKHKSPFLDFWLMISTLLIFQLGFAGQVKNVGPIVLYKNTDEASGRGYTRRF